MVAIFLLTAKYKNACVHSVWCISKNPNGNWSYLPWVCSASKLSYGYSSLNLKCKPTSEAKVELCKRPYTRRHLYPVGARGSVVITQFKGQDEFPLGHDKNRTRFQLFFFFLHVNALVVLSPSTSNFAPIVHVHCILNGLLIC